MYTPDNHFLKLTFQAFFLALMLTLSACGSEPRSEADAYVNFLYANMPHPDFAAQPLAYWQANVEKTLEVRERMGWDVPEREFRHFVLPLRVNNEPLDDLKKK